MLIAGVCAVGHACRCDGDRGSRVDGHPGARRRRRASPPRHGLPQSAVEIARPFGLPITNSMVVTWIVAIFLIVLARTATRA